MNKGLYFWKGQLTPGKKMGIIMGLILVIIVGSVAGWYYLLYIPHKKLEAEIKAKKEEVERQIKQVNDFYLDKLKGGSVERLTLLLTEVYKSRIMLNMTGYQEKAFTCKADACSFSYVTKPGSVFNVQKKMFWSDFYAGSFSDNQMSYSDVPSKLNDNKLLNNYKEKNAISVPECGNMLSYFYSFNSVSNKNELFTITEQPSSSISSVEEKIRNSKKFYGLMFGAWTVTTVNDLPMIMSLFERQAYRDNLIIKNIDLSSGVVNISGGFVCRSAI